MCSHLEIDVKRLLSRCEEMANEDPNKDWRLKKYLESLEAMLLDLQKQPTKPPKDTLANYNRRHLFLKGLIQTTKLINPAQKVVAVQHLAHGAATTGNNVATKEIHQKTTAKYGQELKSELFLNDTGKHLDHLESCAESKICVFSLGGTCSDRPPLRRKQSRCLPDNDETLRHRNISKPPNSKSITNGSEDLDSLLRYHHTMQEKVAENMLLLTRNLKEQTQLASKIIKKDTEVLKSSSNLTDTNLTSLKSEHERLEEQSRKAWKCWLWIMIALVMVIFINMVLFMKIIKKKV